MFMRASMSHPGLSATAVLAGVLAVGSQAWAGPGYRPGPNRGPNTRWVEPVYEMRTRTITEPAVFETRTERVWVEPVFEERTRRVWVEPIVEYRSAPRAGVAFGNRRVQVAATCVQPQPVVVRPGYWDTVCERVCVRPGCWETVTRQVCVKPACTRTVQERVCVRPGCWEPCGPAAPTGLAMNFNFRFGNGR